MLALRGFRRKRKKWKARLMRDDVICGAGSVEDERVSRISAKGYTGVGL